jgi:hypothetical protein
MLMKISDVEASRVGQGSVKSRAGGELENRINSEARTLKRQLQVSSSL